MIRPAGKYWLLTPEGWTVAEWDGEWERWMFLDSDGTFADEQVSGYHIGARIPEPPDPVGFNRWEVTWAPDMEAVMVTKNHRHERVPQPVIITKVGKFWAYFGTGRHDRFEMATGEIDGGEYSSPGEVYPSMEAYEEAVALEKALDELRKLVTRFGASVINPNLRAEHVQAFLDMARDPEA